MARVWRNPQFEDRKMLYGASSALGWRVVRSITSEEGDRKVEQGTMRRIHDGFGKHIGYQIVSTAEQRGDRDLPSLASCAAISARESEANALGHSQTAGLAEDERVTRRHPRNGHRLPPEDFVERTRAKVRVFALVGAARGDILRAWPR